MGTAQRAGGMTKRILAAAFGAIVALAVAGCQLSDDGSGPVDDPGGASVVVQDDGYGSGGDAPPDDSGSDITDGGDESGDDTSSSGSGSSTTDEGYESGGSTSFYDSGSITTTDDGEIIYSDDSGNSISTDF
jgi:hypothetical protein